MVQSHRRPLKGARAKQRAFLTSNICAFMIAVASFTTGLPAAKSQTLAPSSAERVQTLKDPTFTVVPLFEPPAMEPGRGSASLVVGAIAANFWLDGDVSLSGSAEDYFASKTDPLRANPDDAFVTLIDRLRDKPISVPLFTRLRRDKEETPRLGFAWQDENVLPPPAITFRTTLDRQCFTMNLPIHWQTLAEAPLDLPPDAVANERGELRLNVIGLPSEVYATPVANDARQAFGVRCLSHTVVIVAPIAAILLTVDGSFLANIGSEYL